jgi:mannose-1-phosphate guanylyltransferase
MSFVAVIMAGGSGQRFWPLSTADYPKQFLDLEQRGRSLLQATWDRVAPIAADPARVLVVTGERYAGLVAEQLPELPRENVLLEPIGRDTAPAVAWAALTVAQRFGDVVMGLFPADHRIGKPDAFAATLRQAIALAADLGGLITLGIPPTYPATGYGYIQRGEAVGLAYRVRRFVEKPDAVRAEQFVASGEYSWNSGIFVWRSAVILDELARHCPEVLTPLRAALKTDTLAEVFPQVTRISIDYAVLEKTDRAYVIPADIAWDDIGDWLALERLLKRADERANTVVGKHVGLEASGNIIYTHGPDDVVVTLGVSDLLIVKRENTVMIVRKDRVQDIKRLLSDERLATLTLPRSQGEVVPAHRRPSEVG